MDPRLPGRRAGHGIRRLAGPAFCLQRGSGREDTDRELRQRFERLEQWKGRAHGRMKDAIEKTTERRQIVEATQQTDRAVKAWVDTQVKVWEGWMDAVQVSTTGKTGLWDQMRK